MVHLTRLELAHPKALPPQGSVYTNFTTGAYVNYNIFFHYGAKNLKIIPILRSTIFEGLLHRPINNIIKAVFARD